MKNENLPVIKPAWQGNPVDEKDRSINEGFPFLSNFSDLLKWQFSSNPQAEEKENDQARLAVKDPTAFLQSNSDGILWLGHAGVFIRLNGLSIIIDAVFGKPPLVKTFVDVPSPLDII
ncbi:MAG: MBL fold metallo-hydrolase, partial [Pyrinomonadaceae bacterium]